MVVSQKSLIYFSTANLVSLSQGFMIGWLSPALPQLSSPTSTLLVSGPLSNVDVSWIGSINLIGALIGAIAFCFLVTLVGSKRAVLFLSIPFVTIWLLVFFGNTFTYIFCARFIGGLAGGGVDLIILFVSEIASDESVCQVNNLWTIHRILWCWFPFSESADDSVVFKVRLHSFILLFYYIIKIYFYQIFSFFLFKSSLLILILMLFLLQLYFDSFEFSLFSEYWNIFCIYCWCKCRLSIHSMHLYYYSSYICDLIRATPEHATLLSTT